MLFCLYTDKQINTQFQIQFHIDMSNKTGILYGRSPNWSEECEGGVYEKDKEGYFTDNKYEGEIETVNLMGMEFGLSVTEQHMLVNS